MRKIKFIYKLLDEPKNGVIGKFLADNTEYFAEVKATLKSKGISEFIVEGGNFNGYIAVLPEHPFYEKTYDEVNEMLQKKDFYVHGGLTLSGGTDFCSDFHVEYPNYWILGFDTRHADDTSEYWTEERTWQEADKLMQEAINYANW